LISSGNGERGDKDTADEPGGDGDRSMFILGDFKNLE
jgi:hypothetical protein